jgi:exonuclease VII large subunit
MNRISQYQYVLNSSISSYINNNKIRVERISKDNVFRQLEGKILNMNQTLDALNKYLALNMLSVLKNNRNNLDKTLGKLKILSPESALGRGYGIIIRKTDGKVLTSIKEIELHEELDIKLTDGKAIVEVKGLENKP